jgi:hypothetical protein
MSIVGYPRAKPILRLLLRPIFKNSILVLISSGARHPIVLNLDPAFLAKIMSFLFGNNIRFVLILARPQNIFRFLVKLSTDTAYLSLYLKAGDFSLLKT